ncbi:unnamed protein product [Echinostoma caproni]|uniref:Thymidylate_kin domain-containing protein n=1 Tax=Echinostoma caproni TaxID=27848 RepID=A0A183A229_9TREM|nr:unnamed protein product [Echinostoma caproni]
MGAKRGVFVVFEGTDKGGKKTQSKLLADALTQISGKETLYIHFPDKSTPTGQIISRYHAGEIDLAPRAAHLLYTANRCVSYLKFVASSSNLCDSTDMSKDSR